MNTVKLGIKRLTPVNLALSERINGEILDREKTLRGLKIKETPILQGMQIYHNFIKPHEGLDSKTPAEACGIELKGENKWITLIQNASLNTKMPL